MKKLTVLGGSTPFTLTLIDELLSQNTPPHDLHLFGRNTKNLASIGTYAKHQLTKHGWQVSTGTNLHHALIDSTLVLHQIRYGDMAGRKADEEFAQRVRVAADETLGPAATRRLLAMREQLLQLSSMIATVCPQAWVLNLTNPLSMVTSIMSEAGVSQCLGLCELPLYTAAQASRVINPNAKNVRWAYAGLNHRGFITELTVDGVNAIEVMAAENTDFNFNGFSAGIINSLRAIPTKYYQLMVGTGAPAAGRADFLTQLKLEILKELEENPARLPPGLKQRNMAWYRDSVVPVINSLSGSGSNDHIVNLVQADGITIETWAQVKKSSVLSHAHTVVPPAVAKWIDQYKEHERALLNLLREPGLKFLREAIERDPLVPDHAVDLICPELASEFKLN